MEPLRLDRKIITLYNFRKAREINISLRTAYAKDLTLDMDKTSYDDLLDALRLSLRGYHIE